MKDKELREEVIRLKKELDELKKELNEHRFIVRARGDMAATRMSKLEDFLGVSYVYIPEKNATHEYRKKLTANHDAVKEECSVDGEENYKHGGIV